MLSRRLLRVKVVQMVYAFNKRGDISIREMEKELFHSISKSYELYHLVLLLLVDIHGYAVNRIERGKSKKVPSPADLNPNTRFIDNKVLKQLAESDHLLRYQQQTGLSWSDNSQLISSLFKVILDSDMYNEYLVDTNSDYEHDKKFIVKLTEKIIAQQEALYSTFEEMSIFWTDESEFIVSMVIKTLKEFAESKGSEQVFMNEFKDEEDKEFVATLFRDALLKQKEFVALINKFAKIWDLERVAFMDIIIMQVGLTEVTGGFNIPVRVTLNEYIEIAKHYSTPKSGMFVNGILDKIVGHLAKEGRVSMIEE